jgi:TatD DNase family protein
MRSPTIIDTHAHLCDQVFAKDISEVLQRAKDNGVSTVITVSENLIDGQKNLKLAEDFSQILPAAGLHPDNPDPEAAETVSTFIRREQKKLIAIGEVGLDYWVAKEEPKRALQQEIFKQFIKLSLELDLPLNVHSRSAGRYAVSLLLENDARRVQLHAFDGKISAALPAVEAGIFFSIPPSIVRSRQKQKLARQLPLTCLLVETDSPVLGPVPGERNEPFNAGVVVSTIAELKNINRQEVIETTFQNTTRLYGLKPTT